MTHSLLRPATLRGTLTSVLAAALCGVSSLAHAGFNDAIVFGQGGNVTLTVDFNTGGFDHVLELASETGAVGSNPSSIGLTTPDPVSATVLGLLPTAVGGSVSLGSFAAGQELIFRLSNVGSGRLGDLGVIDSTVYTGSSSVFNARPADHYTFVEVLSPTQVRVSFEDLFAISPTDPDALSNFNDGKDLVVTLSVSPVPEAQTLALALAGGLVVTGWARAGRGASGRRRAA